MVSEYGNGGSMPSGEAGAPAPQQRDPFGIYDLRESTAGLGSPLRRFNGVLGKLDTEYRDVERDGKKTKVGTNQLFFSDIDVQQTEEPYILPTAQINIPVSNSKASQWGIFAESVKRIIDSQYSAAQLDKSSPEFVSPEKRPGLRQMAGKRFFMVGADGQGGRPAAHKLRRNVQGTWQEVEVPCWECEKIEGVGSAPTAGGASGGKTKIDQVIELADGLTVAQFNQKFLEKDALKGDMDLLSAFSQPPSSEKNLINSLINAGKIVKDESGVLHKATPDETPF